MIFVFGLENNLSTIPAPDAFAASIEKQRGKNLELSKKHVSKIYNELKKGKIMLEIFRTGLGKQIEYHVKATR